MKTLFKALFLLLLSGVIFGGAALAIYVMFVRPQQLEQAEAAEGTPTPPPDPSLGEFARCEQLRDTGKLAEARDAFTNFVENNPSSTKLEDAKSELGQINTAIFFSPYPSPEKQEYSVQRGDVLMKIAMKMKTTSELIMRSNNLSGTMLRVGEHLLISQPKFSLVISRKDKKVTLLDGGRFFKQYIPLTWEAPPARTSAAVNGRVTEKIAWNNGQEVGFGSKDYEGSARWVEVGVPDFTLYSRTGDNNAKPAGGIELSQEEMEELSTLLGKGVPVTIQ